MLVSGVLNVAAWCAQKQPAKRTTLEAEELGKGRDFDFEVLKDDCKFSVNGLQVFHWA